MSKVYCKRCKYLINKNACTYPDNISNINTWYSWSCGFSSTPEIINTNNDCVWYSAKDGK